MNINRKLKIFKCALRSGETPFASLFITRRCNRTCSFCSVPDHPVEKELTTEEWKQALRKLHTFGVRNITFTGGEPLLREDLGELIRFASIELECLTWLFTNLDNLTPAILVSLSALDFLCAPLFALDSNGQSEGWAKLQAAAAAGMTPAVLATVDFNNTEETLKTAQTAVERGILFDFLPVQNVGGQFSKADARQEGAIASLSHLFNALAAIREKNGTILPSYRLLKEAAEFYHRNNWKCPTDKDPYITLNADGRLMVCQEHVTPLSIFDITSLSDRRWRTAKAEKVKQCRGCSWTSNYQKTFRNPFDLLHESVALLKF